MEKKNGKGYEIDFYSERLIFEGEYLNGQKWTGKEYDIFLIIIYEIKNGNGIIKEYTYDNGLKSSIEYKNGIKNGEATLVNLINNILEGKYINGEINGKVIEYYKNYIIHYDGEYVNGKKNGIVKEYDYKGNLIFEGEYFMDIKEKEENIIKVI